MKRKTAILLVLVILSGLLNSSICFADATWQDFYLWNVTDATNATYDSANCFATLSATAYTGATSLYVKNTTDTETISIVCESKPRLHNDLTYYFSFMAKTVSVTDASKIGIQTARGKFSWLNKWTTEYTNDGWTKYSTEITPTIQTTVFNILFKAGCGAEMYIDDCFLAVKGDSRNLIQNSSFEKYDFKNESYSPTTAEATAAVSVISKDRAKLYNLISLCDAAGIDTPYEDMALKIVDEFVTYAATDVKNTTYYYYVISYATEIADFCAELKDNLNLYLLGKKQPQKVPEINSFDITSDKAGLVADTTMGTRHIFQMGYNVLDYIYDDMEFYKDIHMNYIELNAPIDYFVTKPVACDWVFVDSDENNEITYELTTNAINGNYSLKFSGGNGNGNARIQQAIDCLPRTSYKISVTYSSSSNLENTWFHVNGTSSVGRQKLTAGETKKTQSFTYTTADNQTQLDFLLWYNGVAGAELVIDNITIKKQNKGSNLVSNGDFEAGAPDVGDKNYYICENEFGRIGRLLESAEANGIAVNMAVGFHRLPTYLYNIYDDLTNEGIRGNTYLPFNPDHPEARKIIADFMDTIVPYICQYECVTDFLVMGEPEFMAGNSDYYRNDWTAFLKEKYNNSITLLNNNYQASYADFSDVEPGTYLVGGSSKHSWDWKEFNDSVITDMHSFVAGKYREHTDLPLHSKVMKYIYPYNQWCHLGAGTDQYDILNVMDYNGTDTSARVDDEDGYSPNYQNLIDNMLWYDYIQSIKARPLINSEEHYIKDGSTLNLINSFDDFIGNGIWEGSVRGVTSHIMWLWYRSISSQFASASMAFRPDCAYVVSETAMDMARLSEEIFALANEKSKVGVLYSQPSHIFAKTHQNALSKTYAALSELGIKPHIINDNDTDYSEFDTVIIPNAVNVTQNTLDALNSFDGEIIILGSDSLTKDEYNKAISGALTAEAFVYSLTTSGAFVTTDIREVLKKHITPEIILTDKYTGGDLSEVYYSSADYNDGKILNISNYSETDAKLISLSCDEDVVINLINGEVIGKTFYLLPNEHILLKLIDTDSFKVIDNGSEISAEIHIQDNNSAVIILAVYGSDGKMLDCRISDCDTTVFGISTYKVSCNVVNEKYSVKAFLLNSTGDLSPLVENY